MNQDITNLKEDEIQSLLSKFDKESNFYKYTGIMKWIVTILAVGFSFFQIYAALTGDIPLQLLVPIHLGLGLLLIFLLFPLKKTVKKTNILTNFIDIITPLLGLFSGFYWVFEYKDLIYRAGNYNQVDFIIGLITILLVLEASRRVVGIPITVIAILFLIYAKFGNYFPGFLSFRGLSTERIVSHMYFTLDGIFGTPLQVSAKFIFLFLLFGAFLEKTGVGQYFNDLALLVAGRRVGGPAKVAVFSSALQGTISGSSVANVVTSGSFTIPMMRKLGYRPEFAGAVEAAASTGGQIMPPIMGAAAFLMSEFIGMSYWDIAKAAAVPAVLYFTGIWIMVHFEAKRTGLRGLTKEELPDKIEILKKIYLLIPLVIIIGFLMSGKSAVFSAISGIASTIVVGLIGMVLGHNQMKVKDIFFAFEDGAKSALGVIAATSAAGIIVGTVTLTGLGLKFANGLIDFSGGLLIPTLILTMVSSIILGMGSPTTANYIITSTIAAPAIMQLGVPALSAHMFTFYFGIVADITPPVALAAFAASGIAGGKPIRTGAEATRLAIAAFIIPYIFVLSPQLLLINTTPFKTIWIIATAFIGMLGIGTGLMGYWFRRMFWFERIIAVPAGLMLIIPGTLTDTIGIGLMATLFLIQILTKNKNQTSLVQL